MASAPHMLLCWLSHSVGSVGSRTLLALLLCWLWGLFRHTVGCNHCTLDGRSLGAGPSAAQHRWSSGLGEQANGFSTGEAYQLARCQCVANKCNERSALPRIVPTHFGVAFCRGLGPVNQQAQGAVRRRPRHWRSLKLWQGGLVPGCCWGKVILVRRAPRKR